MRTRTRDDDSPPRAERARVPVLILVMECERPAAGSERCELAGVAHVEIGRAKQRAVRRDGDRLVIGVPDERMSSPHAVIVPAAGGRWVVEDAGSKNGVYVDGARHERVAVVDGSIVELGHTLFRFREQAAGELVATRGLVTLVPELAQRFADLAAVAPTPAPILVHGETGTGKELAARAVAELGGRRGPFVPVNCGALPATLVESELFGYKRGAFSGAAEDRLGLVRSADRGTLFLDEIGDLAAASQAALLRVLQEREVTPLGTTQAIPVDVKLVAATHHDLAARVEDGAFRRDLYARVAAFVLELPPLRDRPDDLGVLVAALAPDGARFTCAAVRALLAYDWPLNIRELASCLTVAAALARGEVIRLAHLPPAVRGEGEPVAALTAEDQASRDDLVGLLQRHAGNVSAIARETGKARAQIHRWLRRYRLDPASYR